MPMLTIGDAILKSADYLRKNGVDSPRLDAELLLCQVLNTDRLHLYMDWQKPLTELEVAGYREYIRRRGQDREPVARIVSHRSFYRREFKVSPGAFVPRPETEGLVERALILLEKEPHLKSGSGAVFEVGTGTGCVIVTLATESDSHHFIASDVSEQALANARENAVMHGVAGRIDFRNGPVFAGYKGAISLIVSNPPYIESERLETLPPEVIRYDPPEALDGGGDGLDIVRAIAREGAALLIPGGWVILELDSHQRGGAAEVFASASVYTDFHVEQDLAGLDRYFMARKSG